MIKKNRNRCFLAILFLITGGAYTQQARLDSLTSAIKTMERDSSMVLALNDLSSEYLQSDNQTKALRYANEALQLAEKIEYLRGKGYALKNMGLVYYYQGDYLNVMEYWTKSLETFERISDTVGIANMVNNLGAVYYTQGANTKAIENYLVSLRISEKKRDTIRMVTSLLNIGGVYSDNPNDYEKALDYYNRAEPYLQNLKDSQLTSSYLLGVGEIYLKQGRYKEAQNYFKEALPYNENSSLYAHNLTKLGETEYRMGSSEAAIEHLTKAYELAQENNQPLPITQALMGLATIYQPTNPRKGLEYYNKAISIAKEVGLQYELRDIYKGMSVAYEGLGRYEDSFKYQKLFLAYKDSLFNLETNDKIRGLQFDFDLEKKQDQIELLEKESEIIQLREKRQKSLVYVSAITSVLVFFLALGMYNRYKYVKRTNHIIEEEKNRSEKLLLNILPYETALELKEYGKVKAQRFDSVSVMFTDFQGFTKYSEGMAPEALVESVDYFFSKFDTIIEKYQLEKIKTIGDSYMCAGGLPFPEENHPVKIVEAAIEILGFVEESRKKESLLANFNIRIGINTGPVVAGVVGLKKFAYDIWGDAVNVASRMENASDPAQINISENTYLLIKDIFECEYRGMIDVKNKGMMKMYFVKGKK